MRMHDILQQEPEIWRLFTCAEEYSEAFRDGYDRFPHYMSSPREPFDPRAFHYLVRQGYRPEYPTTAVRRLPHPRYRCGLLVRALEGVCNPLLSKKRELYKGPRKRQAG